MMVKISPSVAVLSKIMFRWEERRSFSNEVKSNDDDLGEPLKHQSPEIRPGLYLN